MIVETPYTIFEIFQDPKTTFETTLKVVLKSPTFWIVSISHAGDAMVRSSARVLGSYYLATSNGSLNILLRSADNFCGCFLGLGP